MSKTIVLLASGTRGDVQPYIALGLGLRWAGYRVRIAASGQFERMIAERGLEFALLSGNPSDLLNQPGEKEVLRAGGSLRGALRFVRAARPVYARMLDSAEEACRGADAVIAGLASIWGPHLAELTDVPCVWAFLQPFGRTQAFSSALLPLRGMQTAGLRRMSYALTEQLVWLPWRGVINTWRKAHGLRPVGLRSPYREISSSDATVVYGFSPQVAAPPQDWPRSHHVTGYWFLDTTPGWQPPDELRRFLESGDAPVYIGFGSPGTIRPEKTGEVIMEALRLAGLRAVVDLPKDSISKSSDSRQIFSVKDIPHDWLFPRMAALAHHGGAGTTGAGLRAGVPALVIPAGVDQFFWGQRVHELGAGPRPLQQRRLSAASLAERLDELVRGAEMQCKARALGEALRREDGVTAAVEIIRRVVG